MKKSGSMPKTPQEGSGVGALLRASRLRIGEDLRDVAQNLRIRYVYMQAIEEGKYGELPGAAYAVGFVRAYSEYLGLDSGEVVRRFKEEYQGIENRPDLVFPVPVTERSVPGGAVLFLSFIVALISYGAWHFLSNNDEIMAENVPSLPDRLAALLPNGDRDQQVEGEVQDGERASEEQDGNSDAAQEAGNDLGQASDQGMEKEQTADANPTSKPAKEEINVNDTADSTQAGPVKAGQTPRQSRSGDQEKVQPETAEPANLNEQAQTRDQAEDALVSKPAVVVAAKPVGHAVSEFQGSSIVSPPAPVEKPDTIPPVTAEKIQSVAEKTPAAAHAVEPTLSKVEPKEPVLPAVEPVRGAAKKAITEADKVDTAPEETPKPATVEKPAGEGKSRVTVRAKTASWIQVRDDEENKMLLTRLLRAGDSYRVPDKKGLMLLTSNAGALEIFVDGKTVPSIGDFGAVRRSVSLDPIKLMDGSAVGE